MGAFLFNDDRTLGNLYSVVIVPPRFLEAINSIRIIKCVNVSWKVSYLIATLRTVSSMRIM